MRALCALLLLCLVSCHRCPSHPSCPSDMSPAPDLAMPADMALADLSTPADLAAPMPDACIACNAIFNPCNELKLHCYRGCCSADPH